jgi:pimeloyl-ACP methyl ester carboxylesterase
VPAPVLGPASWQPVASHLERRGYPVVVPDLAGFTSDGPPYAQRFLASCTGQIRAAAGRLPGGPPSRVVLVPHSGAAMFAAHLSTALPGAEVVVVYADAAVPEPGRPVPVVDGAFLPYLRQIARDGVVPPWPQWWPDEDLSGLFPDNQVMAAVLAEACPLPLEFFTEQLPALPASEHPAAAFLLFSAGYRELAEAARNRGWPVGELAGEHLHMLVSTAEVGAAILALAGQAQAG